MPVDLVEAIETSVSINRRVGVDVVRGAFVVALKVALHPPINAEVVLLQVE